MRVFAVGIAGGASFGRGEGGEVIAVATMAGFSVASLISGAEMEFAGALDVGADEAGREGSVEGARPDAEDREGVEGADSEAGGFASVATSFGAGC